MAIAMSRFSYCILIFRDNQWVGFDNEKSIKAKVEYAYDQGLAGVMAYAIDTDDFRGDCADPPMTYPLLR